MFFHDSRDHIEVFFSFRNKDYLMVWFHTYSLEADMYI